MRNKFGVLIDSHNLQLWQYNSIKEIVDNGNDLILLIINPEKKKRKIKFNNFAFFLFKFLFVRTSQQKKRDIRTISGNIKILQCKTEKKENDNVYFIENDINEIKSHKLDFILQFGLEILNGEILDSAKYGIWSFNLGDGQKYKGWPYCFWEIYNNEPTTCAILRKLSNKLESEIILKKGVFKTISHSFAKNIDQSLSLVYQWPSQICKEIENKSFQFSTPNFQADSKTNLVPSNYRTIIFIIILFKNKIKNIYRFSIFDYWHVGYINKNINDVINTPIKNSDVNWLKQCSSSYLYADPFIVEKDGKLLLMLEYLRYKGYEGQIKAFSGIKFDVEEPEFSITENYHLSYPNIFKDKGIFFCITESYQGGNLFIYEKLNKGWKKHLIIKDLKCIDPEIFFYNGYYYLFTTIKGCNHDTKLFIYYSKELLNDWKPHILNPVVYDIRSARGAGKVFIKENKLFRPGQNYSIHKEGSITISEIIKISPTEYSEEIISSIEPIKDSKYCDKIHTINSCNDITIIDACERRSLIFRPDILFQIIKSKI